MLQKKYMRIAISHITNSTKAFDYSEKRRLFEEYADYLSRYTGIGYEIIHKVDRSVSDRMPNGQWTGMIGMILRNEIDVCLGNYAMTTARDKIVDFGFPHDITELTFATKHPEFSPEAFSVTDPFTLSVWITTVAFLLLMPLMSHGLLRGRVTLEKSFLNTFATLASQGITFDYPERSRRISFAVWIMGTLILTNCYKSVLLSFFSVPTLTGVRTMRELSDAVAKGKYQCTGFKNSILPNMMIQVGKRHEQIIAHDILKSPFDTEGLDVLLKNYHKKIAFVSPRSFMKSAVPKFYVSKDTFGFITLGNLISKKFCCRTEVNVATLRLLETGLFDKRVNDIEFRKFLRMFAGYVENTEKIRPLSLIQLFGTFEFLLGGYTAAFTVLLIEILWYKYRKPV